MSTAIIRKEPELIEKRGEFNREQIELIKRTVAKGSTDDELALFLYTAQKRGLDPLVKQIYAIKRKTKDGEVMTIQTGIDGFRAVASRTGQLAGSDDAVFDSETSSHPNKATVTVYRMVNGQRCPFSATARWDEYKQVKYSGELMGLWAKMPYTMLAKCAEALALRKAFPEDLSGLYTFDEMAQADNQVMPPKKPNGEADTTIDATEIPPRMDDLNDHIEYIQNAKDIEELQKLYIQAYRRAVEFKDRQAMESIIAAKDAKKAELSCAS